MLIRRLAPLLTVACLAACASQADEEHDASNSAVTTPAQASAEWGDPRDFSAPKYEAAMRAALEGQSLTTSRDVTASFTAADPTQAVAIGYWGHFPNLVKMSEGRQVRDFTCDFVVAATGEDQVIFAGATYALTTTKVTGRAHPYAWGGWSIAFEVDGNLTSGTGPSAIHVNCYNAVGEEAGMLDRYYFEL